MALVIDGVRVPLRWAEEKRSPTAKSNDRDVSALECVKVALINNMPDAALEDTEMQFMELLDAASGDVPVRLSLLSLPKVPRSDRGQQHLANFYGSVDRLWNERFDAVIVTGTEPRQPDLRQEPYWSALTEVLEWAERNTVSTVLSCLAAHAGVLHSDGIRRQPLGNKLFGVFESACVLDHDLTRQAGRSIRFPHSRWNEVRPDELTACGYSVLTRSEQAGADVFVKRRQKSLFVHFQGHPEYGAQTLLREYRRDIKRFLRKERETYPTMPIGYFDGAREKLLADFQEAALRDSREEQIEFFPEPLAAASLRNGWQSSARCIYRNWIRYVLSRTGERAAFAAMAQGRRPSITASNELA
jgi:homoserine O-succinyltransferase